jgi:hypothetical protein
MALGAQSTDTTDCPNQALVAGGGLAGLVRPKGSRDASRAATKAAAQGEEDAAFDRLRRELVHEARAQVRRFYANTCSMRGPSLQAAAKPLWSSACAHVMLSPGWLQQISLAMADTAE